MCGRYAMAIRMAMIRENLEMAGMDVDEELPPDDAVRQSYNVAPGYFEPVYRAVLEGGGGREPRENIDNANSEEAATAEDEGRNVEEDEDANDKERGDLNGKTAKVKYVLSPMKWGLIPFWTKRSPDYGSMLKTINCRDDSLYDNKGMWTTMKNKKRCIVLAQGFFEWLNKGKDKIPHFTKRTDGKLLCMAGLYDCVKYEDATEELYTYSIITTSSSAQLTFLHDRMPVIFDPGSPEIKMWLDPTRRWDLELQKLLKPYEKEGLECYPVKKEVGKVGNNSPLFIIPLDSKENKSNIKNFFAAAGNKKATPVKTEDKSTEEEDFHNEMSALKVSKSERDLAEKVATEENGDVDEGEEGKEEKEEKEVEDGDDEDDHNSKSKEGDADELEANALEPIPDPTSLSPYRSPTKALHITPRSLKRKLGELTPETSMKPLQSSPPKSPSPVKFQQPYYSSSTLGSSPRKGSSPFPSPHKKQKKAPEAKELGNKSITSFFAKK